MGNKKSSGYAKKRKLSGNQFQNMAKELRISGQGETSEANIYFYFRSKDFC
jgi:hypothetical protein